MIYYQGICPLYRSSIFIFLACYHMSFKISTQSGNPVWTKSHGTESDFEFELMYFISVSEMPVVFSKISPYIRCYESCV